MVICITCKARASGKDVTWSDDEIVFSSCHSDVEELSRSGKCEGRGGDAVNHGYLSVLMDRPSQVAACSNSVKTQISLKRPLAEFCGCWGVRKLAGSCLGQESFLWASSPCKLPPLRPVTKDTGTTTRSCRVDFLLAAYSTSAALGPTPHVQCTGSLHDSNCVVKKENRILKAVHCISS